MPLAKKTPAVKKAAKPVASASAKASASARPSGPLRNAPHAAAKRPLLAAHAVAKPLVSPIVHVILDKVVKAKKPKLVRDSFTIPKLEYTVLDDLKQRAGQLNSPVKKSELLRAGIKALAAMSDATLLAALQAVPAIKTGRPSKT